MTRPSLIRFAQISAAALGVAVLAAALAHSTRAGLVSTDQLFVIVTAASALASGAWHGVAAAIERHEERLRAARRHRLPRPDRATMARRPRSGESYIEPFLDRLDEELPEPEPARAAAENRADPYVEEFTARWSAAAGPEAGPVLFDGDLHEDLYAHHPLSST